MRKGGLEPLAGHGKSTGYEPFVTGGDPSNPLRRYRWEHRSRPSAPPFVTTPRAAPFDLDVQTVEARLVASASLRLAALTRGRGDATGRRLAREREERARAVPERRAGSHSFHGSGRSGWYRQKVPVWIAFSRCRASAGCSVPIRSMLSRMRLVTACAPGRSCPRPCAPGRPARRRPIAPRAGIRSRRGAARPGSCPPTGSPRPARPRDPGAAGGTRCARARSRCRRRGPAAAARQRAVAFTQYTDTVIVQAAARV